MTVPTWHNAPSRVQPGYPVVEENRSPDMNDDKCMH